MNDEEIRILINDNVIPVLEALGWSRLRIASSTLYGVTPDGYDIIVPSEIVSTLITPKWRGVGEVPVLFCIVETERGDVLEAIYRMGVFETIDGEVVAGVARWIPWRVEDRNTGMEPILAS